MDKGPAPSRWDISDFARVGALLGTLVGGLFCCYQMTMRGADSHIVRDSTIGGVIGTLLLLGALSTIRNRIMGAKNSR
jgi:hypothetical protein